MGHRASVAYVDETGVAAHYSHWGATGARLLNQIGPNDWYAHGSVKKEPYWEGDTLHEWATDAVDYLFHEAAYVVDTRDEFVVSAYAPLRWLGHEPAQPADGMKEHDHGALVEVENADEYTTVSCREYDWGKEISEAEFVERVQEEFVDCIPEFDRYHPGRFSVADA